MLFGSHLQTVHFLSDEADLAIKGTLHLEGLFSERDTFPEPTVFLSYYLLAQTLIT